MKSLLFLSETEENVPVSQGSISHEALVPRRQRRPFLFSYFSTPSSADRNYYRFIWDFLQRSKIRPIHDGTVSCDFFFPHITQKTRSFYIRTVQDKLCLSLRPRAVILIWNSCSNGVVDPWRRSDSHTESWWPGLWEVWCAQMRLRQEEPILKD